MTDGLEIRCSIQLSYEGNKENKAFFELISTGRF